MPCYSPLAAHRAEGGGKFIFGSPKGQLACGELSLPCGQCIGCRLDRSVDWAVRVMCESQLHRYSSFVTLTYSDENLPYGGVLHYRHFQLFMKKLRKKLGPVRFFMCGEYGDKLWRPHFHAALFGAAFADRYPWRKSSAGFQLYRSELLDSLWDLGGAEIGDLSFESAAYIARYCMKKITGDGAEAHYGRLVPDTGEVVQLPPEFARMSLRSGIGSDWIDKFKFDVIPRDSVVMHGREVPIPRFFLDRLSEEELGAYQVRRYAALPLDSVDGRYDRLRVREIVARAGMSQHSRSLEL